MKLRQILTHPLFLVMPWALVAAELDYMAKKRTKRRRKELARERQVRVEATTRALVE